MDKLHLVTGYKGEEHIQSADQGSFNASFFGGGEFVMEAGNQFEASIMDNNTVRILDGDALMKGRHLRIEPNTYADVNIQTGTAGVNRNDLIVFQYVKDSASGVEDSSIVVIKGTETEGTATDPEYTDSDILGGATFNQMPMYRVKVEGVVLTGIEPLFTVIPTYKKLAEMYAQQFQEACDTYIGLLNILDTMEEVSANTQEGQLAGALALKELAASKVSTDSDARVNRVLFSGSDVARIYTDNDDVFMAHKDANGATQYTGMNKLWQHINSKLPLSGGTMTGDIISKNISSATPNANAIGSHTNPFHIARFNQFSAHKDGAQYGYLAQTVDGTESETGLCMLCVGNNTAQGTAGNARGVVRIFNEGTACAQIKANPALTTAQDFILGTKGGTVPTVSLSGTKLTINL